MFRSGLCFHAQPAVYCRSHYPFEHLTRLQRQQNSPGKDTGLTVGVTNTSSVRSKLRARVRKRTESHTPAPFTTRSQTHFLVADKARQGGTTRPLNLKIFHSTLVFYRVLKCSLGGKIVHGLIVVL